VSLVLIVESLERRKLKMKNSRIDLRVNEKTKKNLINKIEQLGLNNLTELIEKIANEPFAFVRLEFKKDGN
jgi:carbon monoxide dehydrogenase subunit G